MWRTVVEWSGLAVWTVTLAGVLLGRAQVLLERAAGVVRAWRELGRELRPPEGRR
ncbi:hypothetical protein ACFVGM_02620 [Kitasatospora purpeofusca]|uniref:hypothetical protein n=1 Tax=Kitasatospora purpeofusca TaxID=67352 RepID=UPI0036C785C1